MFLLRDFVEKKAAEMREGCLIWDWQHLTGCICCFEHQISTRATFYLVRSSFSLVLLCSSFFAAVTCELFRLLAVWASATTAAGRRQKLCTVCAVTLMAAALPAWCTASTGRSQSAPGNQTIYCLTNLELLAVSVCH